MEAVFAIVLLLGAVIAANILYGLYDRIPLAFYQIGMGLLFTLLPLYHNYRLDPSIFLYAIITPLMFNDAQNTSRRSLTRNFRTTLSLAITLVLVTVLVLGFSIHALWPLFTLPLAFALGAIVSPTDAVAVKSITANIGLPQRVLNTLENESLFNDATGIVALELSLAALRTGHFSVSQGILEFLYAFFGGLMIGAVLGYLIVSLRILLRRRNIGAVQILLPIQILTPFIVYFVAEHFGTSGILAAVAAGLIHGIEQDHLQLTSTKVQFVSQTTWQIISDILNGFVFVLLGLTLPTVVVTLSTQHTVQFFTLLGLAVLIYLVASGLRFLWVYFGFIKINLRHYPKQMISALIATGGIHGTVTLSMALSLPFVVAGHNFPMRNEIIFVAASVILISLLVPTVVMPLLLPKPTQLVPVVDLHLVRNDMLDYAIGQLKNDDATLAQQTVLEALYQQKQDYTRPDHEQLRAVFSQAQAAEQAALAELKQRDELTPELEAWYQRFLTTSDYMTRISTGRFLLLRLKLIFKFRGRFFSRKRRYKAQYAQAQPDREQFIKKIKQQRQQLAVIEESGYNAVTAFLNHQTTPENYAAIAIVQQSYNVRHRRFSNTETANQEQMHLFIAAFQFEYDYVENQLREQKINTTTASQLREQISYDEIVYMQNSQADE
ncbi:cation:proton antiporter [Loigolactobacillus zhaoyuanensis]|uniref:Cation:proton antiporter n=1 Tax=Loigolactobacillus zhaoyuanensis TaxID=2486017 RepID=A0ABW8UBY8_9LACO|nr:sodium:proton antiporter [Loigolactobacillus zhaoyuanensis]